MGSATRRSHAYRPFTRTTAKWEYEIIITAMDVFLRYAFAYTVSNPTAVNTAKVIIDIMTRHAYLPTPIIPDKGSVFVSQVINEVAEIPSKILKHATTKHAKPLAS